MSEKSLQQAVVELNKALFTNKLPYLSSLLLIDCVIAWC